MTLGIKTGRTIVSAGTPTFTHDFTISGFTAAYGAPKGVIFYFTSTTVDGAEGTGVGVKLGLGCTDGSRNWAVAIRNENGKGTTVAWRGSDNAKCIKVLTSLGAAAITASFDSWITDGVRLSFDTFSFSNDLLVTYELIGGTDVENFYANTAVLSTEDTQVQVTDPGFEPTVVGMANIGGSTVAPTTLTTSILSYGFGVNDGSETQVSGAVRFANASATEVAAAETFSTRISSQIGATSVGYTVELSAYTANGFDLYARDGDSSSDYVFYWALELSANSDAWCGIVNSPTATGTNAQTGPGFEPEFVNQIMTGNSAIDTLNVVDPCASFGFGIFDSDNEYSNSIYADDGASTTANGGNIDDTAVRLIDYDGTDLYTAAFSSMDANGWTLNFSTETDSVARKWPALAIKAIGSGTTTAPTTLSPTSLAPTTIVTTLAPTTDVTTIAPTTLEPTTIAPTTLEPTTLAPTTLSPTTLEPTTIAPTSLAPTTLSPTTLEPTTIAPTTLAPTTLPPTSLAPTTIVTTLAPTTDITTIAPTTIAPTTVSPTTLEPTSLSPTTLSPTTLPPTTVAPTSLAPTTLEPTTLSPTTLEPTTIAPTTIVTTSAPTTLSPTTIGPTTLPPTTLTPTTTLTTPAPTTAPPSISACGDKVIKIIQDNDVIDIVQDNLIIEITQC